MQKNNINLSVVDVPCEESYELNGDEICALRFETNIVGAFSNKFSLKAVFDAKEKWEYTNLIGTNICIGYSIWRRLINDLQLVSGQVYRAGIYYMDKSFRSVG